MVTVIDCCEAMHACVEECVWACTRRMLTVMVAARLCTFAVVCIFVPYEAVCPVCCEWSTKYQL